MRVIIKIVLTFILLIVVTVIIEAIKASLGTTYSTGGFGPFIIYPAWMAGTYAIWQYNPDKKENSSIDKTVLKKD